MERDGVERDRADEPERSGASEQAVEPYLIALDVDGTLVTYDDDLDPEVAQAVRELAAAGHHVVYATGRSVAGLTDLVSRVGVDDTWAVTSNGAVTLRLDPKTPRGWTVTESVTFDAERAIRVLQAELPDVLFAVEDVGVGYRLNAPFPEGELRGLQRVVGVEELYATPVTRLVVRSPGHTSEEFHRIVARLGLHDVTYAIGWTAWVDIAPAGVTKASALENIRRELDVAPERTVAIGDGRNDIEMIEWAARGVAMGHAAPEVRAVADEVTGTIEDNGVLPVLRSLLARG